MSKDYAREVGYQFRCKLQCEHNHAMLLLYLHLTISLKLQCMPSLVAF